MTDRPPRRCYNPRRHMKDEKRASDSVEPTPLDREIAQLQEVLSRLVSDTSVLICTHPDDARGPLDSAAVWEWPSAGPSQFPLQNLSVDEWEVCTEYVN
jgi:hypothetical protein